ncbi:zinc finger (CCCH type) motif-containing protein [Toxoplasma gondii ME49]|uniref:Zinc finger (CCCH type) motif-containing protein n=2 Tax=Toxoplasma gondii TaxID=5811 RepID=S8F5X5_TOXGM|nr:zinc finger (CCCH type) motif-containing protein [Toxoplasma gondii ME49]EPT31246.1 zinc finger (CCCH type) motif-containing protein [Toxoplasma gondii ME49]KYF43699.1 zinc finger (CCCH type) motif-containing protein [Toxoplasma gondii ARI]|eukprot:XP_002371103.2 zinc finger (CCCH type) motif-containing protein [Toxoplasma gondii ME49]
MSLLRGGGAVHMTASAWHLGGSTRPVTPGFLSELPESGHEQQAACVSSCVAPTATDANWFSVPDEVDHAEGLRMIGSQVQQKNTSLGRPRADKPCCGRECHAPDRSLCMPDASTGQPVLSCGSVSFEAPISSVSTLTSTATLPPSPVRAQRGICWGSAGSQIESTDVSTSGTSMQLLAGGVASFSGTLEPQESLFVSEPPPSSPPLLRWAPECSRQTFSGARNPSESRRLSFDQNEVYQVRQIQEHTSGTLWRPRPSQPARQQLFNNVSTGAAIGAHTSVLKLDAATSTKSVLQPSGSNWQASNLTYTDTESTTKRWERSLGGAEGVPSACEWDHMPLGGMPQSQINSASLPIAHEEQDAWMGAAGATHRPTMIFDVVSDSRDGNACDESGAFGGGAVFPSAPNVPPPAVCPRAPESGDVLPTAVAPVSKFSPGSGCSQAAARRQVTDSFEIMDACPNTTTAVTADAETFNIEDTAKMQACSSYEVEAGLESWSLCTVGTPAGRCESTTGTVPTTTGFSDGDDRHHHIVEPGILLAPSLDGVASSSVRRVASVTCIPSANGDAFNTEDSQFVDFRAGLTHEMPPEKRTQCHWSGVCSATACVQDGNCALSNTDRSVVESDAVTEAGEPVAYEETKRNVGETCGSSFLADGESAAEGYSGSTWSDPLTGERGRVSARHQRPMSSSSNEDAIETNLFPLLDHTIWNALEEHVAGTACSRPGRLSYNNCAAPSLFDVGAQGGKGQVVAGGTMMLQGSERRNSSLASEGLIRGNGPCIIQKTDGSFLRTKGIAPQDPKKRVLRRVMFSKTKICPWFEQGKCLRGDLCNYAHCRAELRVLPVVKKLCLSYLKVGRCRNPHCSFAHSTEEVEDSKKTKQEAQWQWRHFDVAAGLWESDCAQKAVASDERSSSRLVASSLLMTARLGREAADRTTLQTGQMIDASTSARMSKSLSASPASEGTAGISLQSLMDTRCVEASLCEIFGSRSDLEYINGPKCCRPLNGGRPEERSVAPRVLAEASGKLSSCFSTNENCENGRSHSSWPSGLCQAAGPGIRVQECGTEDSESFMLNDALVASEFQQLTLINVQKGTRLNGHTHGVDGHTTAWIHDGTQSLRQDNQDGRNTESMTDLPNPGSLQPFASHSENEARGSGRGLQRRSTTERLIGDTPLGLQSDVVLAVFRQQLKDMISKFYGDVGGPPPDVTAKPIADAPSEDKGESHRQQTKRQ